MTIREDSVGAVEVQPQVGGRNILEATAPDFVLFQAGLDCFDIELACSVDFSREFSCRIAITRGDLDGDSFRFVAGSVGRAEMSPAMRKREEE